MAIQRIMQLFGSFQPGSRMVDGGELKQLAQMLFSAEDSIVAFAGGGQTGATELTAAINSVGTVATGNDSVKLPLALPGRWIVVSNDAAANSMQVFGQVSNPENGGAGDTIIPIASSTPAATATGVPQAAGDAGIYFCATVGVWKQLLSQ